MALNEKDVEKLEKRFRGIFPTKEEVQEGFDQLRQEIAGLRNDMLSNYDHIYKKLEDMSMEQKMAYAQYRRQEDTLENHEKRIRVLESTSRAS